MKPNKFLIIKPTNLCNYACDFCSSIGDNTKLDQNKLMDFVNRLTQQFSVDCVINGGEPAIMGPDYYKPLLKSDINFLSFQSNCELIYNNIKDWDYLLKDNKFGLGISFQLGCHRKNKMGDVFTPDKFMEYQKFFADNYSKPLFFLSVMVDDNSSDQDIDQLADIIRKLKIGMRISALTYSGNGKKCYIPQYRTIQIYNYILEKHRDIVSYVSPLVEFVKGIDKCSFSSNCNKYILNIEPNGDIYTCGAFGDRKIFKVGTITDEIGIIEDRAKNLNIRHSFIKPKCQSCSIFKECFSCYIRIDDVAQDTPEDRDKYCIEINKLWERIMKIRKILNSY